MFAHKIIEDFTQLVKNLPVAARLSAQEERAYQQFAKDKMSLTNNFDTVEYGLCAHMCINYLTLGQRFYSDALPPEVGLEELPADELKLPYPVTCLMFSDNHVTHSKIAFLCKEVDEDSHLKTVARDYEFTPEISVTVVFKDQTGWYEIANMMYLIGVVDGEVKCEIREHKFCDGLLGNAGNARILVENDVGLRWLRMFFGFLQMLHCSNVETVKEKPDKKLQKSRKKKGKLPLFDYRVLQLVHSDGRRTSMFGGGTHSSPRFHFRRGHFGNRWKGHGEDKKLVRVWISPCAVGNKSDGEIHKEYVV